MSSMPITERTPLISPQNFYPKLESERAFQVRLGTDYEYAPKVYTAAIGTALSAGGAVLALKASAIAMPTLLASSLTATAFTSILATGGLILIGVGAVALLYALVKIGKKHYKENNNDKLTFQVPLRNLAKITYEPAFKHLENITPLQKFQQAPPPLLSNAGKSVASERFKDYE